MEQRKEGIPQQGQLYRHFKGKLYQVVTIAEHTETGEIMVVYQALYGDYKSYVRPLEMFTGEVDRGKYPNVEQKHRFEKVLREEIMNRKEEVKESAVEVQKPLIKEEAPVNLQENLMEFLDANTYQEKMDIFSGMRNHLNERLINNIAVSLDVVLEENSLEERYDALMICMSTRARFDTRR